MKQWRSWLSIVKEYLSVLPSHGKFNTLLNAKVSALVAITVQAQGYEAEIDATIASVEKLRAAGIKLVVGGDYGISIAPHGSYAKDLEYFVDLFLYVASGSDHLCHQKWGAHARPGRHHRHTKIRISR